MSVTALVPMRHHSQRIPGKNFRPLDGKPLYHHILNTLMNVPEVTNIVVDTDSLEIIAGLKTEFPTVKIIERPANLRADDIPMNEILTYDISQIPGEIYLQTHSTNPLLKQETLSRAINFFIDHFKEYDSLFSVTRLQTRIYDAKGKALNHDPKILLQTQDLPPVYEENSCIYLFTKESLLKNGTRIGARPYLFETPPDESWDIDEEIDLKMVELMISANQNTSPDITK